MDDPTVLSAAEVAAALDVDPDQGLGGVEAARRLARDGANELTSTPPVPWWRKLAAQFRDPLVHLLLAAIAISLFAWLVEGMNGWPVDSIVIAVIVLANAAIGLAQESRAAHAVAALASMTEPWSSVVRDTQIVAVPSSEIVRGDVLNLSAGESVGADARLVRAVGLRVQEASLTGESEAAVKTPAPLPGPAPLGDRLNMVYRGTAVVDGVGRAIVTSTGMDTEIGAIADLLDRTEAAPSPLQREIAVVSRTLGLLVIGIAIVVMAAIAIVSGIDDAQDLVTILLLGVSLAVAAVPEGLPAILSLVLALGVRAMAQHHAVVKELHSVETLGSASVICSDKTGTLTRNEMTLRRIITPSGTIELTGVGYRPSGELLEDASRGERGEPLREAHNVLVAGALANNAQLEERDGEWLIQGDPTEAAFLVALHKMEDARAEVERYDRVDEVPFSSERRMMSVLGRERAVGEHRLFVKGAPDVLLQRCTRVRVGGESVPLDEKGRHEVLEAVEGMAADAFRTLGVAYRDIAPERVPDALDESAESGLVLLGVVGIIDPPRDEARVAVADARRAGIRTLMITGDHPATALSIAIDLGIARAGDNALTGNDLDRLDDHELQEAVGSVSVYARVAPEHKLRIVQALRADGAIVAMTGDGVNDAPALKAADIGIAMGITGTEVTKESATMILGDDNFATIVTAVQQGRVIFDNIKKFLRYLLSSNLGEVATVFFGVVLAGVIGLRDAAAPNAVVVPLLATQILWINLVTDSAPALAMGVDPQVDDVMARPPRPRDARILDRAAWTRIGYIGAAVGLVTLLTIDLFLPGGLIDGSESLEVARTAGFTTLVLAQMFNALNARSDRTSAFRHLFDNSWLWGAIILGVGLQVCVVQLPVLQTAFGTASLSPAQWAVCAAMASLVLWLEEIVKVVRRSLQRRLRPR